MRGSTHNVVSGNSLRRFSKSFPVLFLILTLTFSLVPFNAAYAGTAFTLNDANISQTGLNSFTPRVFSSGSDVYVIWQENFDIFFTNSTDSGVTFDTTSPVRNLSGTSTVTNQDQHQFAVNGQNIYVVWVDALDVFFKKSNDNGDTFDAVVDFSDSDPTFSSEPSITSSGSNVYVAWREGGFVSDIFFKRATNNGDTLGAVVDLTNTAGTFSHDPQMTSSGSNVYAVWNEENDILFRASTDSGVSFVPIITSNAINLSGAGVASEPQIVEDGNNVYIIWRENSDVFFRSSNDSGANFNPAINLSSNALVTSQNAHKIAVDPVNDNIYVVWQEGTDIQFRQSTNGGVNFDAVENLSSTATGSFVPQVEVSGDNVYVSWREGDTADDDTDIRLRSITTAGGSFGGTIDLSGDNEHADEPSIAVTGNDVFVVWSQKSDAVSVDGEIQISGGTASNTTVEFLATQYRLTETATIRVTSSAFNLDAGNIDTISLNVISDSDNTGININLDETDVNSGIFEGDITFTTGDSSGTILKVSTGDTVSATFDGVQGSASIFQRTVTLDKGSYELGDIASVIVTDQNSNIDPLVRETIGVTFSSQIAGKDVTLTLTETDFNTGIFGGAADIELIFAQGNHNFPTSGTITVSIKDTNANQTESIETTTVDVTSNADPGGIEVDVTETSGKSAIFEGELTLTTGDSDDASDTIKVAPGNILQVTSGAFTSNALIIPNNDPSRGLLQVTVTDTTAETITASFGGKEDTADVKFNIEEEGGGGGGLIRPSLVLDFTAALLSGGGGGGPPSFTSSSSSNPFEAASGGFGGIIENQSPEDLIPDSAESDLVSNSDTSKKDSSKPVTFKKNEKVVLDFDLIETRGDLKHATLYMNEGEIDGYLEEFTFIRWDDKGVTINDEKGVFNEAGIEIIEKEDGSGLTLRFTMAFGSEVDESDVLLKVWNLKRQAARIAYEDAFKVTGSLDESISESLSSEIISETSQETKTQEIPEEIKVESEPSDGSIPAWVKTSASWWSENQINDKDFVLGLEHLVKEDIIQIPKTQVNTGESQNIPEWIKSTAGWWSEGGITDDEFKNAVQWLIERGVMKV